MKEHTRTRTGKNILYSRIEEQIMIHELILYTPSNQGRECIIHSLLKTKYDNIQGIRIYMGYIYKVPGYIWGTSTKYRKIINKTY